MPDDTIDLRNRLLLWHKLLCLCTGDITLTYAKDGLKRSQVITWIRYLRNVADELESVLAGNGYILDGRGERVVDSGTGPEMMGGTARGTAHEKVATVTTDPIRKATDRKVGGLRVATRKKQ